MILAMLEKHEQVWVINVRGNHDPDAALWLNEVMRFTSSLTHASEFDNLSKFVWFKWGKNLVVTHHGDKIKMANLYGSITRNLRKEWGESKHTFVWTGHIHHKIRKSMAEPYSSRLTSLPRLTHGTRLAGTPAPGA